MDAIFEEKYAFGTMMRLFRVVKNAARLMHKQTLTNLDRPFGLKLCVLGFDENDHKPQIFDIDPVGNIYEYNVTCIGAYSRHFLDFSWNNVSDSWSSREMVAQSFERFRGHLNAADIDELPLIEAHQIDIIVIDSSSVSSWSPHDVEGLVNDRTMKTNKNESKS